MRRSFWLLAVALAFAAPAWAHPAPFSYLDVRIDEAGIGGAIVVHDFDVAHDLGIDPPDRLLDPGEARAARARLIALLTPRIRLRTEGEVLTIVWGDLAPEPERQSLRLAFAVRAPRPARLAIDAYVFPYDPVHQTFVNVYEDGRLRQQAILDANRRSVDYYSGTTQGALAVIRAFVPAGIEHILIGPDHVLFLVGLLLLGGSLWRLGTIVTAFTLGHSLTLSLAALDVFSPPARIIEPMIALSIVFVGTDNLLVRKTHGQRDLRPAFAAAFGLIHGFGFASVLRELGLPASALGWSLFSFNVGVEIGQLAIVLLVASALGAIRRRSARAGDRLALAGSLAVVAAGTYWFVQRVFFFS